MKQWLKEDYVILDEDFQYELLRFIKGTEATALENEILTRELKMVHQTAVAKAARKSLPSTIGRKGGSINVGSLRRMVVQRVENKLEKESAFLDRQQAKVAKLRLAEAKKFIELQKPFWALRKKNISAHSQWEKRQRARYVASCRKVRK